MLPAIGGDRLLWSASWPRVGTVAKDHFGPATACTALRHAQVDPCIGNCPMVGSANAPARSAAQRVHSGVTPSSRRAVRSNQAGELRWAGQRAVPRLAASTNVTTALSGRTALVTRVGRGIGLVVAVSLARHASPRPATWHRWASWLATARLSSRSAGACVSIRPSGWPPCRSTP